MSYNPNNPNGQATSANSAPVVLDTTDSGYLSTIATNTGASATDFQASGTISALNGTVSITGQGTYTTTASITGTWSASLVFEGQAQDLTWNLIPMNQINGTNLLPLVGPITSNGLYNITGGGFLQVRVRASAYTSGTVAVGLDSSLAQQSMFAITSTPDMFMTGASAQTATVNNILPVTSGTAATDAYGYHSASVQVVSTGTAGTFIFEGSNDNVNFQAITVYNQLILTGTPITAAITATASQFIYNFPVSMRFIRLRIATTITGGSIQAFTKLSQTAFTPSIFQVAQATTGNLNTTSTIASGTVTTVSTVTAITGVNAVATTNGETLGTGITTATPATVSIKATAGRLHFMSVGNPNTTAVYLKLFNVATPTLGTTSANMNFYIPASSTIFMPINISGLFFSTAIVYAVTGGPSLTDNTVITTGCEVNYSFI